MAQTDLLALGRQEAQELLSDPQSVQRRIREELGALEALSPSDVEFYKRKAEALAEYMVHRKVYSKNLLRNAEAIARKFGERGDQGKAIDAGVTDDLIRRIGRLTSLYAYRTLDPVVKDQLKDLATTEANGMEHVIGMQATTRALELRQRDDQFELNQTARANGWKGYVPSVVQEGMSVILAPERDHDRLVERGYVWIGSYEGAREDTTRERMGYYQSSVAGRNTFRQGAAQTVHGAWQGVDPRNGKTMGPETSSSIRGDAAEKIWFKLKNRKNLDGAGEGNHLLPIFSPDGQVMAYERPLSAEMLERLPRDTHLGRMLGVWSGRILEENAANDFNRQLVDVLKKVYDAEKETRGKEFVNVADPETEDPVIRDAWDTLGWEIKEYATEVFGKGKFLPVRRDMVNDAIGYRAASITDPWTGISRWSPEVQKGIKNLVTLMAGDKGYGYLKTGEQLVQDAVSYAKTTIIVRGVVVGVGNILSNLLHLSLRGINPLTATRKLREKFIETTEYVKNLEEIQRLTIELAAQINDPRKSKRLKAQIEALQDANANMSIKPLIDAGEFSTISENLTEADVAIREGRWGDYLEKVTEKLPGWSQTAAKNVLITKDTALFQGLNRMVQYGDFIAKAVLYDHLKETTQMSQEEIMSDILEEYVQYNRLSIWVLGCL